MFNKLPVNSKKKVGRTLQLEPSVNARLVALCAHLGVNPNAYLLNEVGKAISRDEVFFHLIKPNLGELEG